MQVTAPPAGKTQWGTLLSRLYVQVLIAIVLGAALGVFAPTSAEAMKPLGDGFIKLIKMMIAPIIFVTVVHGVAAMRDMKRVGRVGLKALIYFELVTTVALIIGLAVANIVQPGAGMNIDAATIDAKDVAVYTAKAKDQGVVQFLLDVIPSAFFGAFADGNILQVLLLAVLFALGLLTLGSRGDGLLGVIAETSEVLFRMVGFIMRLAPIGAFGAMAFTIGKYGLAKLKGLALLMGSFYVTAALFVLVVLGLIARLNGFSILQFIRFIEEEILIVIGTSSSESVLPRMIRKLETAGAEESVAGLVIPSGYSFNLDGTCIYLTMASVFLAQATNTPMTLSEQIGLIGVLLLTSKGAAGVTGSGFVTLAATLSTVGTIPVASLALILGIDRFMSEARAVTNLIGNGIATIVIAKSEGAMDEKKFARAMAGESGIAD